MNGRSCFVQLIYLIAKQLYHYNYFARRKECYSSYHTKAKLKSNLAECWTTSKVKGNSAKLRKKFRKFRMWIAVNITVWRHFAIVFLGWLVACPEFHDSGKHRSSESVVCCRERGATTLGVIIVVRVIVAACFDEAKFSHWIWWLWVFGECTTVGFEIKGHLGFIEKIDAFILDCQSIERFALQ